MIWHGQESPNLHIIPQVNGHPVCSSVVKKLQGFHLKEPGGVEIPIEIRSQRTVPLHKRQREHWHFTEFCLQDMAKAEAVIICGQRSHCTFTSMLGGECQPVQPYMEEFSLLLHVSSMFWSDGWVPDFCAKPPNYLMWFIGEDNNFCWWFLNHKCLLYCFFAKLRLNFFR